MVAVPHYWIDQVALKVNGLSDTVFIKEKLLLQKLVMKTKQYSKSRNLIVNGDFNDGITNWKVNGTANIQKINNNSMLVFSQWDSSISRTISLAVLNEDSEYVLRMISGGKGKLILTHGIEKDAKIEILSATNTEFYPVELSFYPESTILHLQIQSKDNKFIVDSVEIIKIPDGEE